MRLRLVVIEDSLDYADLLSAQLRAGIGRSLEIFCLRDLRSAVGHLRAHGGDCVLCDLALPDACGLAGVEALTCAAPAVPLVVITGSKDDSLPLRAVLAGAQDFLVKGDFDTAMLVKTVRHAIARHRLQSQVAHLALHDPLTGLANRTLFFDRLEHAIARALRTRQSVALFYIDLDGFKQMNDLYGHTVGDTVLRGIARRLVLSLRSADTVARLGGDEFAVLIDATSSRQELDLLMGRLERTISAAESFEGVELTINASIGMAIGDGSEQADQLIALADASMYRQKATAVRAHEGD